jgi:hypothetical protein
MLADIAGMNGLGVAFAHRGLRSVGPSSSIARALPALRRVFPNGLFSIDLSIVRFADVEPDAHVVPRRPLRSSISCV